MNRDPINGHNFFFVDLRLSKTQEAPSRPPHHEVHRLDPSGVIKNPVHSSPLNLKTKMTSLEVKRDDLTHQRRYVGGASAPLQSINKRPCKACLGNKHQWYFQQLKSGYLLHTTTARRLLNQLFCFFLSLLLFPGKISSFLSFLRLSLVRLRCFFKRSLHVFKPGMKCSASDKDLSQLVHFLFVPGSGTASSCASRAANSAAFTTGRLSSSSAMLSNQSVVPDASAF